MPLQWVMMALTTFVCAPAIYAFALIGWKRAAYDPIRIWCRAFQLVTGTRARVRGLEHIPADGRYLIVANHSSHLDGPTLISALPDPIYFVIKKELSEVPLWGPATLQAGFIAVDRGDSAQAREQMARAAEAIASGRVVLVFAEGTRSAGDDLLPFKKGAFHLAVAAGVPVLPVAINGSRDLLPKGAWAARPGTMDIVIAPPVPTTGLQAEDVPGLLSRTRSAILDGRRPDPRIRS